MLHFLSKSDKLDFGSCLVLTLLAKKNYFISCFLEIKNSHICRKKLRLTLETSSSSRHRIVASFQVIIFMLLCGVCFVLF